MLEEARNQCHKSGKKRIITLTIIIVLFLAAPLLAPIRFLIGPTNLSGKTDINYDSYKNRYVKFEIKYSFGQYVETTSKTTQNNRVVSTKKVSNGYIVYNWDDDSCFAVEVPVAQSDLMDDIIDGTVLYFYDRTEPQKTLTVKGSLQELKGEELKYYQETLDELETVLGGIKNSAVIYKLVDGKINSIPFEIIYVIYYIVAILVICALYAFIRMKTGAANSKLKKFLAANPGVSEEQVSSDMNSAVKIGKTVWAGRRFTVWTVGLYIHIISNKDLVWAYYYKQTGRNPVSQVRTFNKDHRMVVINLSENLSHELLKAYQNSQPQMELGYDRDLEKQYNKDFAGFLERRYNPAQNMVSDNDYNNMYNTEFREENYTSTEETTRKYDD